MEGRKSPTSVSSSTPDRILRGNNRQITRDRTNLLAIFPSFFFFFFPSTRTLRHFSHPPIPAVYRGRKIPYLGEVFTAPLETSKGQLVIGLATK